MTQQVPDRPEIWIWTATATETRTDAEPKLAERRQAQCTLRPAPYDSATHSKA